MPNMDEALYSAISAPPLARQSSVIPAMPVTYTWENIEAEAEIVQGNIFNRKKYPTIRKRILNNGKYKYKLSLVKLSFSI